MLEHLVRGFALVASLIVAVGFMAFVTDELSSASIAHQRLAGYQPPGAEVAPPGERRDVLREKIDNVSHTLLHPFEGVVRSDNAWVRHAIPTLLALLVYGLGLPFLAGYLRGIP